MTISATQIEASIQQKEPTELFNIASYLPSMAKESPDQLAVVIPQSRKNVGLAKYTSMTFAEMEVYSNRCANGLTHAGFEPGIRVLVMVKPGFDFVGVIFALFKMGAVPVMIDPGMGVNRLLDCIRMVDPQAIVGIPLAHVVRVLKPSAFKSIRKIVTVGRRWFWGGTTLKQLTRNASSTFDIVNTKRSDTAAILFTSGSTGPAKGVVYQHGMFDAQVRMIQAFYDIQSGEIDMPAFPIFVLFSIAMGMTAVIPEMDPSHPVKVDPKNIVSAIHDHQVTNTFGSPAIWKKVAAHCVENDIKLPSMRYKISGRCTKKWRFSPVSFPDPGMLFADALRTVLAKRGVTFSGEIERRRVRSPNGSLPDSLIPITNHRTSMVDVLSRTGKNSQNLFAECLLKRSGYAWSKRNHDPSPQGNWETGRLAVMDMMTQAGIGTQGFVVADGSGLSRENQCTARQMVSLLTYAHKNR